MDLLFSTPTNGCQKSEVIIKNNTEEVFSMDMEKEILHLKYLEMNLTFNEINDLAITYYYLNKETPKAKEIKEQIILTTYKIIITRKNKIDNLVFIEKINYTIKTFNPEKNIPFQHLFEKAYKKAKCNTEKTKSILLPSEKNILEDFKKYLSQIKIYKPNSTIKVYIEEYILFRELKNPDGAKKILFNRYGINEHIEFKDKILCKEAENNFKKIETLETIIEIFKYILSDETKNKVHKYKLILTNLILENYSYGKNDLSKYIDYEYIKFIQAKKQLNIKYEDKLIVEYLQSKGYKCSPQNFCKNYRKPFKLKVILYKEKNA